MASMLSQLKALASNGVKKSPGLMMKAKSLHNSSAPLSEKQAAAFLGISIYTLQRIRKRGEIGFSQIGRKCQYTLENLQAYVTKQSKGPCAISDFKSETIGSPKGQVLKSSTPHGSTSGPDKQTAVLLAQKIFGKPK